MIINLFESKYITPSFFNLYVALEEEKKLWSTCDSVGRDMRCYM